MRFAPYYARAQAIFPAELKSKIQVLFPRRGGSKVSLASPEHGMQFGDVEDSGCSCSSDDSMRDAPESKVTCMQLMIFGLALAADRVAIKMSMPIFLLFYDSNANHKFSTDGSVRGARESEGCAGMPSADSLQRHPDLL